MFCYELVCTTTSDSSHVVCRRTNRQKTGVWHCGSITLVFFFTSTTKMNHLFDKKSKKSLKYSQRDIFLGIPTSIAAGPLGFRAELDIGPNGEQNRSYQDLEVDWTDSIVALDENSSKGSRIVFQGKTSEDQEFSAQETSTPDAVVGDTDHGHGTSSEWVRSCHLD